MPTKPTPAALLTIELGSATGAVHWTIKAWRHEGVQGAYDMSVQHRSGAFMMGPGRPRGEQRLEADIRLALANTTGWMVLSDSSGRFEEGTRF